MKLKIIDLFWCPECLSSGMEFNRKYKVSGDFDESKIFDGFIECNNKHKWQIRDELLRFDQVHEELMLYDTINADYDSKQIFPSEVARADYRSLREIFNDLTLKLEMKNKVVMLTGESLPLLDSLETLNFDIVVVHPDESYLRHAQEVAAKRGIYARTFFILAKSLKALDRESIISVALFGGDQDVDISFNFKGKGKSFWSGETGELFLEDNMKLFDND